MLVTCLRVSNLELLSVFKSPAFLARLTKLESLRNILIGFMQGVLVYNHERLVDSKQSMSRGSFFIEAILSVADLTESLSDEEVSEKFKELYLDKEIEDILVNNSRLVDRIASNPAMMMSIPMKSNSFSKVLASHVKTSKKLTSQTALEVSKKYQEGAEILLGNGSMMQWTFDQLDQLRIVYASSQEIVDLILDRYQ